MTVLTKDQEASVYALIPELGFLMRLCKEIIALANALDATTDELLIAMRRNLLSDQVTLLATTFKMTEQWCATQSGIVDSLKIHYGESVMKEAERFTKLSDPSIVLEEKIELVRQYLIFQSNVTLEHGASLRIEERDDQYWFDGMDVDHYFSAFVIEYHPLVRALALKHNRPNDLARMGFEHRFRLAHREQAMLIELLYTHVFSAVQVARLVPYSKEKLSRQGVDLDRLVAFVEAHIRGENLGSQAATLLTFESRVTEDAETQTVAVARWPPKGWLSDLSHDPFHSL